MKRKKIKLIKPKLKSFNCGNCGAVVEIKLIGQTLTVTCTSCKSIIDASDPNYKIIQEHNNKRKFYPYIPIGTRGKLKGVKWECVGFTIKSDSGFYWREYLLFNPYNGYRWLVEVDGHWSLFKRIHHYNEGTFSSKKITKYKGKIYKLFNIGDARVEYVEGEFFWRVKRGDVTQMIDLIAPPQGLSVEKSRYEQNWTQGSHIDENVVQKAFAIDEAPPLKLGVGQLQPSPYKEKLNQNFKVLLVALVAIVALSGLRLMTAEREVVYQQALNHKVTGISNTDIFKSRTFHLEGGTSNIKIDVQTRLKNAWLYLDALLVDAKTQKGIPVPVEVSYYAGYSGGERWSEGSQDKSKFYANIPDGEYYLSIRSQGAQRGGTNVLYKDYTVRVIRDEFVWSNVIVVLILLFIGPFLSFFASSSYESQRWANSDYSPYGE